MGRERPRDELAVGWEASAHIPPLFLQHKHVVRGGMHGLGTEMTKYGWSDAGGLTLDITFRAAT